MQKNRRSSFGRWHDIISTFVNFLEKIGRELMLLIMISILMVLGCNIVLRYFFSISFSWALEFSQYGFIYIVFIGTAISLNDDSHAKVAFFYEKALAKIKKLLFFVNSSVMLIMCYVFIVNGFGEVIGKWRFRGINLPFLPIGFVYLAIPICGFVMLIIIIKQFTALLMKESGK